MSGYWQRDIDAVTTNANGEYWIFKGDRCVRTNQAGNKITAGPVAISDEWTVLRGTAFAQGIDAIHRSDGYWVFKGDQCAKTNTAGDAYLVAPKKIIDEWTILKDL